ncbi:MAG: hypothetical protein KOO61_10340 [Spirochaetales bacterium]|nr:hypothetical protein [Spirochaetales bacterium]
MVDPATGARFTGQSAQIHLSSQSNLRSLSPGAAVRVFVEDIGAGGSVVLRLRGRLVPATTPFPLRKGEWYVVRPQQTAGRLSLRLESQVSRAVMSAEIVRSAGMPDDAIAEAVVRAFLRTGLPVLPDRLQRAYRRVLSASKGSRHAKELARLEALAERKGLFFDDLLVVSGSPGSHSWSYGSGDPGSHGRREVEGDEAERSSEPNEDDIRASFRLSTDADHPLQLFNHVVGEGDHWVVIPISAPGSDLQASLRIRIPRGYALGSDRSLPAVREAVLVVTRDGSRWLFGLQPTGSGLRVVLLSQPDGTAEIAGLGELAGRLDALGIRFDQDTLTAAADDGFSQTDAADILTSVDSSA